MTTLSARSCTHRLGILVGIFACATALEANTDSSAPCWVLSASQVSAIVREPVLVVTGADSKQGEPTQHCKFAGGNVSVEVTVLRADSEHAAVQHYEKALRRATDDHRSRDEPLHGVGIESRYRMTEKGSTIIARFGVHVVVVSTNAGREEVVGLARAVGARATIQ